MILTCPNCSVRYLLAGEILGDEGRRVKCTACEEIWFQEPEDSDTEAYEAEDLQEPEIHDIPPEEDDESEDIPDSVKPIPEDKEISDVESAAGRGGLSKADLHGALVALAVFIILSAAFVALHGPVMKAWPASYGGYKMLGFEMSAPGEGLVFDGVQAHIARGGEKAKIEISGQIINLTDQDKPVSMIRAALRDSAGIELEHWMITPPVEEVKAEETVAFSAVNETDHKDAQEVNLSFTLQMGVQAQEEEEEEEESHEEAAPEEHGGGEHDDGEHDDGEHASEPDHGGGHH